MSITYAKFKLIFLTQHTDVHFLFIHLFTVVRTNDRATFFFEKCSLNAVEKYIYMIPQSSLDKLEL